MRDRGLVARLSAREGEVLEATDRYEVAARDVQLHKLDRAQFGPEVNQEQKELEDLYKRRLAKKGTPARLIYNRIKLAASTCPLCGHRNVETLDHHLPKAQFSYLAVSPSNLIPACSDCNHMKNANFPVVPECETLHPYFDSIDQDIWLVASVDDTTYPVVDFYVSPPASWPELLIARVRHHFEVFELNFLYGRQAVSELAGDRHYIDLVFDRAGSAGVRSHFEDMGQSWRYSQRNHWRAALYSSLAESDWYCAGGFNRQ